MSSLPIGLMKGSKHVAEESTEINEETANIQEELFNLQEKHHGEKIGWKEKREIKQLERKLEYIYISIYLFHLFHLFHFTK